MASPRLETFCCPNRDPATSAMLFFTPLGFNAVCLTSAAVSLVGSLMQLLPRVHKARGGGGGRGGPPPPREELSPGAYRDTGGAGGPHASPHVSAARTTRLSASTHIVRMLALCDTMGCLGVIVRSSVWVSSPSFVAGMSTVNATYVWPSVFCASTAIWIQLFYSANFLWAFCFAADAYLVAKRAAGSSTMTLYHIIAWGLACLLCVEGVLTLYYPSLFMCEQSIEHAIPHYICTYIPMFMGFFVNPILFSRTVTTVSSLLKGRHGIYTENERRLECQLRTHFFKIMLVFFICWIPNIINEALLFVQELSLGLGEKANRDIKNTVFITWYMMGILNPLQGFLNSLAYQGWKGCGFRGPRAASRTPSWGSVTGDTGADDNWIGSPASSPNGYGQMSRESSGEDGIGKEETPSGSQTLDTLGSLSCKGSEDSLIELDAETVHFEGTADPQDGYDNGVSEASGTPTWGASISSSH
ncbi:G-protein coupled receptor 143 [Lethenteron reissneri]|uniref:G-protein coupled receptor 143 n=1 Tax=Lethenteron reissneri TaxID=7753 RepID=UPI002AB71F92|nr:G-protein coupled receptor 143 [Lethenteron reissneri]